MPRDLGEHEDAPRKAPTGWAAYIRIPMPSGVDAWVRVEDDCLHLQMPIAVRADVAEALIEAARHIMDQVRDYPE